MPDKSWRGMRPGPVTALLCISYAFPDSIRIDLRKLFHWLWSATYVAFFLLALFLNTPRFMQMRLLAGIRKRCHFETGIKVNTQVVCITKPSPVAAPFMSSSLPVSLFSSAVFRHTIKICSCSFSQSWAAAFWEDKQNIQLIAGESPNGLLPVVQSHAEHVHSLCNCYIQKSKCYCNTWHVFVDICLAFCFM